MIVMDIRINNFFAFKNFHMNMSYPKKIVDSFIQDEFLKDHPNFRYKKVNILTGANATGKTSFGRMLMRIFNFMDKKQFESIVRCINDPQETAEFSMDFVVGVDDCSLYRIFVQITPPVGNEYLASDIQACVKKEKIRAKDSYESCCQRLEAQPHENSGSYMEELDKVEGLSWLFEYPSDGRNTYKIPTENHGEYLTILENTLRALDPSIKKVEKIESVENTFVIRMDKKSVIIQDGKTIETEVLSSGTKAGINIANVVAAIKNGMNGFYYCDEKFSYIHSDIEKAFLSVMISCLKSNDQLFFTTHNTDILELPLPKHSFIIMKKEMNDPEQPIKCISVSDYLKRNTDSVRNAVDNDLFSAAPGVELIYEIGELT